MGQPLSISSVRHQMPGGSEVISSSDSSSRAPGPFSARRARKDLGSEE